MTDFDLIVRGATIVDGSGSPGYLADLAVAGGQIAAITTLGEDVRAPVEIDARGRHLMPGFIDIHSHSDFVLADPQHGEILRCFLEQGITTVVTGNCGFAPAPSSPEHQSDMESYTAFLRSPGAPTGWPTFGAYLDQLDSQGVALNVVPLAAHGAMRIANMGFAGSKPTEDQLKRMVRAADEAMDAGAFGISAGLAYAPGMYATTAEVTAIAARSGRQGGLFTCHSRGLSETLVDAVSEVVQITRDAGVRGQFSHLSALGEANWPRIGEAINVLENARRSGVDVATDCQAYVAGNTTLTAVFPPWSLEGGVHALVARLNDSRSRARIRSEVLHGVPTWPLVSGNWTDNMIASLGWDGIWLLQVSAPEFHQFEGGSLLDMAEARGVDPFDALCDLIQAGGGESMMLVVGSAGSLKSDAPLRDILALPFTSLETDAIITGDGVPNRGAIGAFPRMLGHFVRDEGLLSLPQAVHQMTGLAADRLGLTGAGRIRHGAAADLVIVDMDKVADTTDYRNPRSTPEGITDVIVNGVPVVGAHASGPQHAGRVYRRTAAA
ncbi:MAG: D-aminoacylase [Marmoricola sp.]|jgi:N-acyl-D-amino-acid deacylase|nr:D-aminoacylase [Marmoricola sp.]